MSLGLIGLVAFLMVTLLPVAGGLRAGGAAAAASAAVVAFLVASAGFALWETEPGSLVLLGLLLGCASWRPPEPSVPLVESDALSRGA